MAGKRGRPKGSKSKTHNGYLVRTRKLKMRYGNDIFKVWGTKGGNPILKIKRRGE